MKSTENNVDTRITQEQVKFPYRIYIISVSAEFDGCADRNCNIRFLEISRFLFPMSISQ